MSIELLELELEQPELEMINFLNRFWPDTLCKRVGGCISGLSETHRYLVFELAESAPQAVGTAQAHPIRQRPDTEESADYTVCCVVCIVCV